jgi:CRISPR/Cas system CSM-associated protein Csm2 small subunit
MFTGKKIDKKIIEKALENSNFAPSHKLTQPWLFKIFSGVSKKKLAEKMTDLYKKDIKNKNILKSRIEKIYKKCEKSDYII